MPYRRNAPKGNAYTVHRKNQYKATLRNQINQINAKIELKPPTNQHKPKVAKTSPSNVNGHKNKIQIPIVRFSHRIRSKKTITPTETPNNSTSHSDRHNRAKFQHSFGFHNPKNLSQQTLLPISNQKRSAHHNPKTNH